MRELFDITPHSTGPGFRMRLKTGEIDVPDGRGGYIVSSGMGSGKTESIKSLIRHKHDEGILYCVDTRDELEKMFGWIVENLVVEGVLRMEDVMIISSDPGRADFLGQYRDNPEVLMEKKVILITHVRFWTDLINHFLIYKPQKEVAPFDGDFRTLMGRDDLRGYVIFDETPTFINPFVEFDRSMLGIFGKTDENGNIVCKPPEELGRYYDLFIRGGRNDLFNQAYRINRMKRDVVLRLIPKYYGSWVMSDTDKVTKNDAKEIFREMAEKGGEPEDIAKREGMLIVSDTGKVLEVIEKVLAANEKAVNQYKGGDVKVFGFLMGQCNKELRGAATPKVVKEELEKKLKSL